MCAQILKIASWRLNSAMDVCGIPRILHLVWILLVIFNLLTCVPSQGDVWFSLNSTTYQNNSCVTLEDIGDNYDTALLCMTNLTACCGQSGNRSALGNWFFPNGTVVPSSGQQWDFRRTRYRSVVRLNRRRGGVEGIYCCEIPDSMNVTQTIYIGVYTANRSTASIPEENTSPWTKGTTSPPQTVPQTVETTTPPQTVGTTSPLQTVGTTSPPQTVGTTSPPQPTKIVGTTTTTVPVSSSSTQPTTNPPSDGATTTSVIIVVAVVIILVVIVVGVVILVVLLRTKKRKQQLEINKLQNVMTETELKSKQEEFTEEKASSRSDQPLYAGIIPSKSEDVEFLRQNHDLSEYEVVPGDREYALPAKLPRVIDLSNPMFEEMESNLMYQSLDQCCESPSTTNVLQGINSC